jgi:hypothetical protein
MTLSNWCYKNLSLDRDPDIQSKMIRQLEIIDNQREEIKDVKERYSN